MMTSALRGRPSLAGAILALAVAFGATLAGPSAAQAPLAAQTSSQGPVTIVVKPVALSVSAAQWRFEVVQDTHSVALDHDMREAAALGGGAGGEHKPAAWEGDGAGGHHRKGVLVFAPISPAPDKVTLKIRGIGGVAERTFTWTVPK